MSYNNARTTDKYIKIKREGDKAPENEIRIRADPKIGRYIAYAATLLLEKKLDTVVIKASGVATKSACQVAEILRHRILNLHQVVELKTTSVIDEYEPQEEGLDRVKIERKLAVLEITLSLKESALNVKAPGYQVPLPKDQVQEEELKDLVQRRRPVRAGEQREERRPFREGEERRPFREGDDRRGPRRGGRGGFRGGYRGGDRRDDREDRRDNRDNRDNRRDDRRDNREDRRPYRGDGEPREDRRPFREGEERRPFREGDDRRPRGGFRGGRGGRGGFRGGRGGFRGGNRDQQ